MTNTTGDIDRTIRKLVVYLMNSPPVDDEDHEYDEEIYAGVWAIKTLLAEERQKVLKEVEAEVKKNQWSNSKAAKGSIMWSQEIGHRKALDQTLAIIERLKGEV